MASQKKSSKKSKTSLPETDPICLEETPETEIDHLEDIEKEQKETNVWLAVNTIFTVISGIAMLLLTILTFLK